MQFSSGRGFGWGELPGPGGSGWWGLSTCMRAASLHGRGGFLKRMRLCSFGVQRWDGGTYRGGIKCGRIVENNPGGAPKAAKRNQGWRVGTGGTACGSSTYIAAHPWFSSTAAVQPRRQPATAQRSLSA